MRPSSADSLRISLFIPCFIDQLTPQVSQASLEERIHILGAHGPKELNLVLIG
jgi:hypothetical protein